MIPISCDQCGFCSSCRFEYLDPDKNDLPMLFCSIDCLTKYVKECGSASKDETLAEGEQRKNTLFH